MKESVEIQVIGYVKSEFSSPGDPMAMREKESTIEISPEYSEGLFRIEENEYLTVIFHFHQSDGYRLIGPRRDGQITGVFASRSPRRPGAVGVTTVRLIERKANELRVEGLDAIDGTPVLDIKPYVAFLDDGIRGKG